MRVTVHTLRRMLQGLEVGLLCIKIQIFKKSKGSCICVGGDIGIFGKI